MELEVEWKVKKQKKRNCMELEKKAEKEAEMEM